MENYLGWNSNCTEDIEYYYEYITKSPKLYGIHPVKIKYLDNTEIETFAKFDTGAKSTSISFELGKKIGLPDNLFNIAEELENLAIDKGILKEDLELLVENLNSKYTEVKLSSVRSASGVNIRLSFPIQISYDGRIINTIANLKNRQGLRAEMLIGLNDML